MKIQKILQVTFSLLVLLQPLELFARAGGGSSGGGGSGGIIGIILLPFFLIYAAFLHYKLNKKNKEAINLVDKIAKIDPIWERNHIKARIEYVFYKVQNAWGERNQDLAKDCMSDRLYTKHKMQTDSMIEKNQIDNMELINLIEVRIVEAIDYKDDSKDTLWAYIKGSMIDYTTDLNTGRVISGKKDKSEEFTELWKFIRGEKDWVLDEIDQKVQITDFYKFHSKSEEIKNTTP